jgi:TfoX C-terminal domain
VSFHFAAFADYSHPMSRALTPQPRTDLNALGPASRAMLQKIGIHSMRTLRKRGAIAVYVALKRAVPGVSLNMLYSLVSALDGGTWLQVKRERKADLLAALAAYEDNHPRKKMGSDTYIRD